MYPYNKINSSVYICILILCMWLYGATNPSEVHEPSHLAPNPVRQCETSVTKATPLLTLAPCNPSYIRFSATVTKQLSPLIPTRTPPPLPFSESASSGESDRIEKEG